MSFMVSQQVFWYPNDTRTITRTNHLGNASVILGFHMRYINFDNLMNESLSFKTILTKVTFVTVSVAYLILDSTCFVLGMPLGTFILLMCLSSATLNPLLHCPEVLNFSTKNQILWFAKPDSPILTDLLRSFFFWTDSYIISFLFATKAPSLR
jgi:hypothetical protein